MRRNYIYDILCICRCVFEQYECSDCVVQRQHCVYHRHFARQRDDNGHCVAQAVHEHIDEHIRDGKRQHAGDNTGDDSFVRTGVSKTGKEKQIKEK